MKHEKSCGCIVIFEDKVLVIKQNTGSYGFPKGHMEENETEVETALRETKEEAGVDAIIDSTKRYSTTYSKGANTIKEAVYFKATTTSTSVNRQIAEVAEVMWLDIDKVHDILTFSDMKEIWLNLLNEL